MKTRNFNLILAAFILSVLITPGISQKMYRKFETKRYQDYLLNSNQASEADYEKIKKHALEFKKNPKIKKVTLPLVFHIIYATGDNYPNQEKVIAQVEAVNRDFGKKAYKSKHKADTLDGFISKAVDTEISFCLAQLAPNGTTTDGVNFVPTTITLWNDYNLLKSNANQGQDSWDTQKYINIWVANLDSITGYSQMPGGPQEWDGIVIDFEFFGVDNTSVSEYNQGKTLTHLLGNYLSLHDLWGSCYCCDDEVGDTPVHNAPNYGPTDIYKHVSICPGYPTEMSMNFMDNTDDDWMYMFTEGQKIRMHAMLDEDGPRYALVNANTACTKNSTNLALRSNEGVALFLYPNPSKDLASLELTTSKKGSCTLQAINSLGQTIMINNFIAEAGFNTWSIPTADWPNGHYMIMINIHQQLFHKHLVIVH